MICSEKSGRLLLKGSMRWPLLTRGCKCTRCLFQLERDFLGFQMKRQWRAVCQFHTPQACFSFSPTIEINAKVIHIFISKMQSRCFNLFENWLTNDSFSHYYFDYVTASWIQFWTLSPQLIVLPYDHQSLPTDNIDWRPD